MVKLYSDLREELLVANVLGRITRGDSNCRSSGSDDLGLLVPDDLVANFATAKAIQVSCSVFHRVHCEHHEFDRFEG